MLICLYNLIELILGRCKWLDKKLRKCLVMIIKTLVIFWLIEPTLKSIKLKGIGSCEDCFQYSLLMSIYISSFLNLFRLELNDAEGYLSLEGFVKMLITFTCNDSFLSTIGSFQYSFVAFIQSSNIHIETRILVQDDFDQALSKHFFLPSIFLLMPVRFLWMRQLSKKYYGITNRNETTRKKT